MDSKAIIDCRIIATVTIVFVFALSLYWRDTLFDRLSYHSLLHFCPKKYTFALPFAGVAKLADALDLGSNAARHGGSSPSARTDTKETRA
jgi:hypothetical protein